jgi:opacity protein-like surface antigen
MTKGMTALLRTGLTLLILGSLAAPARADWFLTPFVGVAFGGTSNQFVFNDLDDEFEQRAVFGGSIGYRTKGIFGVEVEYAAAPNFFQYTAGTNNFNLVDLGQSVQTLMGNVIVSIRVGGSHGGGFQPYVTAGFGSIRTQLRSESDAIPDLVDHDPGFNAGVGANVFAATHFGFRADVRYFRGIESLDNDDPVANPFFDQQIAKDVFNFWRGSLGLTFRW